MASDQLVEPDPPETGPRATDGTRANPRASAPREAPSNAATGGAAFVTGGRVSRRLKGQGQRESRQAARTSTSRFTAVPQVDGPRVRLGCLWFVVVAAAMLTETRILAAVLGIVAAVAALQGSQSWIGQKHHRPNRAVAGICAFAMPLAATVDPVAVLVVVAVLFIGAVAAGFLDRRPWTTPAGDAMTTIRTALLVGLAAASVVLIHRMSLTVSLTLLVLVSAYETGDYLVGSGAANAIEGPLTGAAAVAVFSFALGVFSPPPFTEQGAWAIGALTAVLCPLGQLLASVLLPASTADAPALRRLDSLLLTAPVWCSIFWQTVGFPENLSL